MKAAFKHFLCSTLILFSATSSFAQSKDVVGGRFSEALNKVKNEQELSRHYGERLDVIAKNMGTNRATVFKFFKERSAQMTEAKSLAWSKLLSATKVSSRKTITPQDSLNAQVMAQTVSSFIRIKNSKAFDKLDFDEVDLAKTTSWEPKQKENFANVLKRTAEIAETSNLPTQNLAFEQALKELGYWNEYIKGCK